MTNSSQRKVVRGAITYYRRGKFLRRYWTGHFIIKGMEYQVTDRTLKATIRKAEAHAAAVYAAEVAKLQAETYNFGDIDGNGEEK